MKQFKFYYCPPGSTDARRIARGGRRTELHDAEGRIDEDKFTYEFRGETYSVDKFFPVFEIETGEEEDPKCDHRHYFVSE